MHDHLPKESIPRCAQEDMQLIVLASCWRTAVRRDKRQALSGADVVVAEVPEGG